MSDSKPTFLITIDTEGDNLWEKLSTITTKNSRFLPRFQELCEKYKFKPTWLTNYEMAMCSIFTDLGHDVLRRRVGEIGMHLHAWNSPPIVRHDTRNTTYLIEYPENIMKEKIGFMTELLEQRFQCKVVSHRAGRWALDTTYVRLLIDHGYKVDCSVTPHVSWANHPGGCDGSGGSDYTHFPVGPYFMDLDRIDRQGNSPLLELPVSIVQRFTTLHRMASQTPFLIRKGLRRLFSPVI